MPIILDRLPLARLSATILRLSADGHAHPLPLLRALLADEIALAILLPGDRLPLACLDPLRCRKPLVVLLGGDGAGPRGSPDCGPEGWRQSRRLLRWARWTMIHGARAEPWHYQEVADAARKHGRVLLAECGTATLPAWESLRTQVAPRTPCVIVKTEPGDFYPRFAATYHEARS